VQSPWRIDSPRPVAAERGRTRRHPRWTAVALAGGLAVQLIPVLIFSTVLTQDGPAHVDGAWVLVHHGDGGPVGAALREHYRIDLAPVPNMATTLLLAALLRVMGPDSAERLLVAGLLVGLTVALRYALRGVDRGAGWLAVAALPFCGSYLVAFGFYNFVCGVVGALLVLGLALRRRSGWSARATTGLTLLLLGTWSAHLLPFTIALGALALVALARVADERQSGLPLRRALRRHILPVLVAVLPSAGLTVAYLLSGVGSGRPTGFPSLERVLTLLSGVRPFAVGDQAELWPALLAAGALAVPALVPRRRPPPGPASARSCAERRALGGLLLATTVAFCGSPGSLGPAFGFLYDRLAWFPPLLLVLWSATRRPGRRVAVLVVPLVLVAASAAVLVRLPAQAAAARDTEELLSVASELAPGSTFAVLQYVRSGRAGESPTGVPPDPLRHESSRLAVRARAVDVGHYEAATPYFQVTFSGGPDVRGRLDPGRAGLERIPPRVRLPAVRGDLDYVLVVGLDRAGDRTRAAPATSAVLDELAGHYSRVATSFPTGLVQVWRVDDG